MARSPPAKNSSVDNIESRIIEFSLVKIKKKAFILLVEGKIAPKSSEDLRRFFHFSLSAKLLRRPSDPAFEMCKDSKKLSRRL